jgi:hypothetical protein
MNEISQYTVKIYAISSGFKWARPVAGTEDRRKTFWILIGKPKRKTQLRNLDVMLKWNCKDEN